MFQFDQVPTVSGHVFRREGRRGAVWYAKYRLPDGRQVQKRIGPAWSGRGRPTDGSFTKRSAEAWLREVLREAEGRDAAGSVPDGRDVRRGRRRVAALRRGGPRVQADDAARLPHLGPQPVPARVRRAAPGGHHDARHRALARGADELGAHAQQAADPAHGIFKRARKVYGLARNPVADVEKLREPRYTDLEVFSPEEVHALVRAAAGEQDGAIFLTAAFTGLRMGELLALRWRDVDFGGRVVRVRASYTDGALTTPKSGKVRSVPLGGEVAAALARLGSRSRWSGDDDLVFANELGGFIDGSALRRRYKAALDRAGLRRLRFHDLRHTFGTRMIGRADILRVKEWMGHANVQTTMRYLHFAPRPDDARLVDEAFNTGARAFASAA